jgi:hypothetical protein
MDVAQIDGSSDDLDPRPGVVAGNDDFLGRWESRFEISDAQSEILTSVGGGQAVTYIRQNEQTADLVVIAETEMPDGMAIHLDRQNPDNSYLITQ